MELLPSRFSASQLCRLSVALGIPEIIRTQDRVCCGREEALAIVLYRMNYPNKWSRMVRVFGRSATALCMIFQHVCRLLFIRYRAKLHFDMQYIIPNLQRFSSAIHAAGGAMNNVWAFIDGTARRIARPKKDQRITFSGHKRFHCLKFQSLVTPDGLISHLFGPIEGRHHDLYLLKVSGLHELLSTNPAFANFLIYGDPGYKCDSILSCPHKGANLSADQLAFNKSMSSVRVSVEWGFGRVQQDWAFLNYHHTLRVGQSMVGAYYILGVLLTNARTCLDEGNLISFKFGVAPPSLEDYLAI